MIIDCHGHFTTVPASFRNWRAKQIESANDPANAPPLAGAHVSDDEIREGVGNGQLRLQKERGGDLTLFSPIAGLMSHHLGNERTSLEWAEVSNDLVRRVCDIYRGQLRAGVPAAAVAAGAAEELRCRAAPLRRGDGLCRL